MTMTPQEKLLAEIIADRFDRGDTKTQIRADLEAERGEKFTEQEWASLVFASAFAGAMKGKAAKHVDRKAEEGDLTINLSCRGGEWSAEIKEDKK